MTSSEIAAVLESFPTLNAHGMGGFDGIPREQRPDQIRRDQEELLHDVDGCTRAETWLRGQYYQKAMNRRYSSYGFKHLAEHKFGYLTNGAFITAAIHLGFPHKIRQDSPNVLFGIKLRRPNGRPGLTVPPFIEKPPNYEPLSPRTRFLILRRDDYRCRICGRRADDGVRLHVDHHVPRSKGGSNDSSNLWTLCEKCNLGKSNLHI